MRDFSRVAPQFWTGSTGRSIRDHARDHGRDHQVIAFYVITCPNANMLGLYYLPLPTLSHETGIDHEGASEALRSLEKLGFCRYDHQTETIWVLEMARFQIGDHLDPKDNRVKAVHRELITYANSPFFNDFLKKYGRAYHLAPLEGLRRGLQGALEPLRSQEQEQEQDQEDQIHDHRPAAPRLFDDRPPDQPRVSKARRELLAWFEAEFWPAYFGGRRVAKKRAIAAILKLAPDLAMRTTLIAALKRQAPWYADTDPEHIPHPATWINGERWNDESAVRGARSSPPRPAAPTGPIVDDPDETARKYLRKESRS